MNSKAFFDYAQKREAIRLQRLHDAPWPWTSDEVLQRFRFCNIFREDDVVTQWIRENIREPMRGDSGVLLSMVIARFINRTETLASIRDSLATPKRASFDDWNLRRGRVESCLRDCAPPIVTGAYMVKTPAGMDKIAGLMWIFDQFAVDAEHLCSRIEPGETTLQGVHEALVQYPFIGSFMAYEVVTDMRHTDWLCDAPDVNSWAAIGPGAARGLARIIHGEPRGFNYSSTKHQEEMLGHMQVLLDHSRQPSNWRWASERPWEMREVEHTLCEFDKYERARLGEGKPKQLYTPKR